GRRQAVAVNADIPARLLVAARGHAAATPSVAVALIDAAEVAVVVDDGSPAIAVVERGITPVAVSLLASRIQTVAVGAHVAAGLPVASVGKTAALPLRGHAPIISRQDAPDRTPGAGLAPPPPSQGPAPQK